MREVLNYYYNLDNQNIIKKDNNYYFLNYIVLEYTRNLDEVNDIFNINKYNDKLKIIVNKQKQILFLYNNKYYMLIKYINILDNYNIDLLDILEMQRKSIGEKANFKYFKWIQLWSKKIDYYEYQIEHLNIKYYKLMNVLPYYIGLAENAISYLTDSLIDLAPTILDNLTISHKRVSSKYKQNDLYNPLNIIIDHKARDIAEYIKSSFYNKTLNIEELDKMFLEIRLSDLGYHILFARLLFPSNFFDIYDRIINSQMDIKNINIILENSIEYEELLVDLFYIIKKYTNLKNIDWLTKKKYY
ncbi:MAG: hypothetical protein RR359_00805 [Bacilli bacterium]